MISMVAATLISSVFQFYSAEMRSFHACEEPREQAPADENSGDINSMSVATKSCCEMLFESQEEYSRKKCVDCTSAFLEASTIKQDCRTRECCFNNPVCMETAAGSFMLHRASEASSSSHYKSRRFGEESSFKS